MQSHTSITHSHNTQLRLPQLLYHTIPTTYYAYTYYLRLHLLVLPIPTYTYLLSIPTTYGV